MANGKTVKAADIQRAALSASAHRGRATSARAKSTVAPAVKFEEPLTSVIAKVPGGYIGQVEEIPGAFTQGETVDEVRANLVEVTRLMIQTQREAAQKEIAEEEHKEVFKEPLGKIFIS